MPGRRPAPVSTGRQRARGRGPSGQHGGQHPAAPRPGRRRTRRPRPDSAATARPGRRTRRPGRRSTNGTVDRGHPPGAQPRPAAPRRPGRAAATASARRRWTGRTRVASGRAVAGRQPRRRDRERMRGPREPRSRPHARHGAGREPARRTGARRSRPTGRAAVAGDEAVQHPHRRRPAAAGHSSVQVMSGGRTRAQRGPPCASVRPSRPTSTPSPSCAARSMRGRDVAEQQLGPPEHGERVVVDRAPAQVEEAGAGPAVHPRPADVEQPVDLAAGRPRTPRSRPARRPAPGRPPRPCAAPRRARCRGAARRPARRRRGPGRSLPSIRMCTLQNSRPRPTTASRAPWDRTPLGGADREVDRAADDAGGAAAQRPGPRRSGIRSASRRSATIASSRASGAPTQ